MIVTVGNTKGVTGKTTFAVQIALERQAAGRTVLLIDADRQVSAQKVMTMRAENGHQPLACVQLPTAGCYVPNSPPWPSSTTTP
jgi:cellulose biosynthesis protein BcsQ